MSALDEELLVDPDDDTPDVGDQPYTDLGNARRLVTAHGNDLRYAPQLGAWLAWDGRRWAEDVTGEAHRRAKAVVDAMVTQLAVTPSSRRAKLFKHWMRSQSAGRINAMVDLARTEPGIPALVADLDADPWALNTLTGIVDLRTGELRPHDRTAMITKLAPVTYDPDARCPRWEAFVHWAMCGRTDLVNYLQRAIGYSLTGVVTEQVMHFPHGHGANGKSTLLGVLVDMLGDYAVMIDPELLMAADHAQHPTGLTALVGRRLAVAQETEQGRRLAESTVKQLTGGDRITARRMRQDFFQFDPTHKLWMAANHRPVVRGTDHAIWRRIRLIPFEASIDTGERDEQLRDRLRDESPGILNWAIAGCLAWQRDGLDPPATVAAATNEYRSEQDHIGRFIEDTCLLGDGWAVSASALRDAYEAWCKENGERPWSARAMAPQLRERGCERFKDRHTNRSHWRGITLAATPTADDRPLDDDDDAGTDSTRDTATDGADGLW